MTDRRRSTIVSALTTFVVFATLMQMAIAALYARGVNRVRMMPSLDARYVRVLARPLRIAVGTTIPRARVIEHLRGIGYYEGCAGSPGCFVVNDEESSVSVWARYPETPNVALQWAGDALSSVTSISGAVTNEASLEPETLFTLGEHAIDTRSRASYDFVPATALAGTPLVDAIVASEDRWFYSHHGIDLPRLALMPLLGSGASTITMQVARLHVLHDRRRTVSRKLNEIGAAIAIDRAFTKEAVLAAYVNTVGLGARGGRPVYGFGAAAREFFGIRDIRQLSVLQAATLVALLNQPSRYLDHLSDGDDTRLRAQRNRVLWLMERNFPSRYSAATIARLAIQPVALGPRTAEPDSLLKISRHFVDYALPALPSFTAGRVYLTIDGDYQRIAAASMAEGLDAVQSKLPGHSPVQGALIALDPSTGEVLAMIGGRSYDDSQLNRATSARRQVGSIMKPFDYLAAFERARAEGRHDLSPSTTVLDQPTVFTFQGWRPWRPANYGNDYAGVTTWRRALAESRNVAAVKVAALAGINRIAALWEAASGQRVPARFPSLALGAIEATPIEVASAYEVFATGGVTHGVRGIAALAPDGEPLATAAPLERHVAHEASVAPLVEMMRAVLDEGTGRGARAAGFTLEAAGKTGTTNELRDAWFAGFSGRLLTVVWVGRDDDRPLGLTGAQAALPIWTAFMKRALQPNDTTR